MIVGIGTDIVAVARMQQSLSRHQGRIAQRILSPAELEEFGQRNEKMRPHFLAKRFAAKEAAAKALGTGFRAGIQLPQIEVGHDEQGKPLLQWYGAALKQFQQLSATTAHLSISDEESHAVAFVILEKN
ncbi:MAG: holo-ACP synthase [Gammaproteobacteria bacterium]|jgi:holo-[acyl-carrier protein] synthase|nr:holo-ACP synthase [Gammaproteobacteria bacterium]MBT4606701.1 holo-ACP synthase [Thiotrichales bacterium]MBT3473002.1 holo-ACP synthase [Gammaproteobacteria bacterium]MBT3966581.1 holo-ACP synthase [Gammaproteobacteria bacterium]MBT4080731.1 holo-ACP synthase [Gammaproteobacteria bacterium]